MATNGTQPFTAVFPPTALVSAREIVEQVNISRAHLHTLVKSQKFPAPAIKAGSRYTRWRWSDITAYLEDPAGWVERNTAAAEAAHA